MRFVPTISDAASALAQVPSASGVGQIVAGEKSLLLGVAANLRRWAASHLGLGKPARPGRRPKTNLAGLATAIGWVEVDGPFRQRLVYERLSAPLVPLSARRDLKPPAFLRLDQGERFPRVSVRSGEAAGCGVFGPFASRGAAEKARDELHRRFALRPCDATFEPAPALPLGLGCVYAQVRSCSAPCLLRITEDDYRSLAGRAVAWLRDPASREPEAGVPAVVTSTDASRALVVDAGRETVGLVPVRAGRVLDPAALVTRLDGLDDAVSRLSWPHGEGAADWPWLTSWLRSPKARACYLVLREDEETAQLVARVRAALASRFSGKLGAAREEA